MNVRHVNRNSTVTRDRKSTFRSARGEELKFDRIRVELALERIEFGEAFDVNVRGSRGRHLKPLHPVS